MTEIGVSDGDKLARMHLANQMRQLPDEAFTRALNVQGAVGCAYACAFCSQGAGGDITQLTRSDVNNFIAAMTTVAKEVAERYPYQDRLGYGLLGYDRVEHKPGVIFPYFDNDPFSFPYLDNLISGLYRDLSCRVRISTVGYPRNNIGLQRMHEAIVSQDAGAFSGLRFSLSRYPKGWLNQDEYVADFANALMTYRPIIDQIGSDKEAACVEMRFAPHAYTSPNQLDDRFINGRHALHAGSQLLIAKDQGIKPVKTKVNGIAGRTALLSNEGVAYQLFTSDELIDNENWLSFAEYASKNLPTTDGMAYVYMPGFEDTVLTKAGQLFQLTNTDGDYYAFNPSFDREGYFAAMHFYPKTDRRRVSGYLDTTRFFLNTLLAFKSEHGIDRRGSFLEADWSDVDQIIQRLETDQHQFDRYDKRTASYLHQEVIPLIRRYQQILHSAGLPPNFFFSRFTIDTGSIVNQGRALGQFRGLVSTNDIPLTPQEERGYGDSVSIASQRGRVWRWAPVPFLLNFSNKGLKVTGAKNLLSSRGKIAAYELDYHNLSPTTPDGDLLRVVEIDGFELERASNE